MDTAISQSYSANKTDEFIEPTLIDPQGIIKSGDAVIFYNFRIDRPRQLTKAFVLPNFEETANHTGFDPYAVKYMAKHVEDISGKPPPFTRGPQIPNLYFVTMTEYEQHLPRSNSFPSPNGRISFGKNNFKRRPPSTSSIRIRKERFVTYYFNCQYDQSFPGEDRLIIPSPKVSTYDKRPEMSALEVTQTAISKIQSDSYDLIVMNYANPDMVGHTGNLKATITACGVVDTCLGDLSRNIW